MGMGGSPVPKSGGGGTSREVRRAAGQRGSARGAAERSPGGAARGARCSRRGSRLRRCGEPARCPPPCSREKHGGASPANGAPGASPPPSPPPAGPGVRAGAPRDPPAAASPVLGCRVSGERGGHRFLQPCPGPGWCSGGDGRSAAPSPGSLPRAAPCPLLAAGCAGLARKALPERRSPKDPWNSGSASYLALSRGWMLPFADAYF